MFGDAFLGLRKSELGDRGWELWWLDAFGSRLARALVGRADGDSYLIRLARLWGSKEGSLIDQFIPGEGVAERAFDLRVAVEAIFDHAA